MCWELCGLDIDASPEEVKLYEAWLEAGGDDDPEEELTPEDSTEDVEIEWEEDEEESEPETHITEREALSRFDDFLNECWETVHICGYSYDPAQALKQCDEVAYREEFNNWLDSEGLELI